MAEKCVPTWLSLPWDNDTFISGISGGGLLSDQVRTSHKYRGTSLVRNPHPPRIATGP